MNTRSCSVVVLHFCLHPQTCFQGLTFNMIHLGLKVFKNTCKGWVPTESCFKWASALEIDICLSLLIFVCPAFLSSSANL